MKTESTIAKRSNLINLKPLGGKASWPKPTAYTLARGRSYPEHSDEQILTLIADNWCNLSKEAVLEIFAIRTGRTVDPALAEAVLGDREFPDDMQTLMESSEGNDQPTAKAPVAGKAATVVCGLPAAEAAIWLERYLRRLALLYRKGFLNFSPNYGQNGSFRCDYTTTDQCGIRRCFLASSLAEAVQFVDDCERKYVPEPYRVLMLPSVEEYKTFIKNYRLFYADNAGRLPDVYKVRRRKITLNFVYGYFRKHFPNLLKAKDRKKGLNDAI